MKSENRSIIILCLYVIVMIAILLFSLYLLKDSEKNKVQKNDLNVYVSEEIETKIVYVPIHTEITESTEEISTAEVKIEFFTVKSYGEKIGIFNEKDVLVNVIEVYTKTLPKADRDLLEKGIVVFDDAELRSIIEDYTG